MAIYTIKLLHKRTIAQDTIAFHFEKPENFCFQAGQYGGFTLIDAKEKDDRGITRRFSFLSAPEEKHLSIATRFQQNHSAYKRALKQLNIGEYIKCAGPNGTFTLSHLDDQNNTARPLIFIAGGIGIAPFYSMLQHEKQQGFSAPITLFYANRSIESAPLLKELFALSHDIDLFQLVHCIETIANACSNDFHEQGYITPTILIKYQNNLMAPLYYICGSKPFVAAQAAILATLNIPSAQVISEDFPGY